VPEEEEEVCTRACARYDRFLKCAHRNVALSNKAGSCTHVY